MSLVLSRAALVSSFRSCLLRKCRENMLVNNKRWASNRTQLMLMDLPRKVPTIFESIQVRIKLSFTMMLLDPTFRSNQFMKGAQQALLLISNLISRGDFESLRGLVHENSIEIIRNNYARLSSQQKAMIATQKDDIQMKAFHMFETANAPDGTYVKIGVVFQIVPGLNELLQHPLSNPQTQLEIIRKFQNDHTVAEYQFVRQYQSGKSSDWLVSELNHWAMADYLEEEKK